MNSYFLRLFIAVSTCTITAISTVVAGIATKSITAIGFMTAKNTAFAILSIVFMNLSTADFFDFTSSATAILMYIAVRMNLAIKFIHEMCLVYSFADNKLDVRLRFSFSFPSFFYGYQNRACFYIL